MSKVKIFSGSAHATSKLVEDVNAFMGNFGTFRYWENDPEQYYLLTSNWRSLEAEGLIEEITEQEFNSRMLTKNLIL